MIRKIVCICCFITSLNLVAQEEVSIITAPDISISLYTMTIKDPQITVYKKPIVDVLKLKDFKFMIYDQDIFKNGTFKYDLRNVGRRSTNFSSLVYKDYDLYKHFPVIPDIVVLNRFNSIEGTNNN